MIVLYDSLLYDFSNQPGMKVNPIIVNDFLEIYLIMCYIALK